MKALVTGIKPYTARLADPWIDRTGRRYDTFKPIRTRKQVLEASRWNSNTGNYLIGEGAIDLVGREKAHFFDFGYLKRRTADPDYLTSIHEQFDCVVFATANLLRSDYDAGSEADLLSRFDLPIVIVGIGCQRIRDFAGGLPPGTLRFIEVLKSKVHHVFTRGGTTADYLRSVGLTDVWPTGCPSLFLRPENVVAGVHALKTVDWGARLRTAFCGYLGKDPAAARDMHFFGDRQPGCSYVLQDEQLFYGFNFDVADEQVIYNDLSGELLRGCSYRGSKGLEDVRMRLFFNSDQWRASLSTHDVCFGRRFHGIIAGLQAAVPSLMIAIDDRMREMISQSGLPHIDLSEWNAAADKRALIGAKLAGFDAERFGDRLLESVELANERLRAIGLGRD